MTEKSDFYRNLALSLPPGSPEHMKAADMHLRSSGRHDEADKLSRMALDCLMNELVKQQYGRRPI
jgi:hypothetical protein